jgi:hypothetical protein
MLTVASFEKVGFIYRRIGDEAGAALKFLTVAGAGAAYK